MEILYSINSIRNAVRALKAQGKKVAFVPTMGALHDGHLSLIRLAKKYADEIVVSIYVNPEQFGPNDDFASYPSKIEEDLDFCKKEGVSLVFIPDTEIMYGVGAKYFSIEIKELNTHLDGGSRPGYFQGISLVVNKLFNIVEPDIAIFGQKDYQQFQIIQQMVKEFNHDVELIMAPIQRAEDGLALSSRNAYLSKEERTVAPELFRKMNEAIENIQNGELEPEELFKRYQEELELIGFRNDYFEVYSLERMAPIKTLVKGESYVLATAAYLGKARLIDNIIFKC